MATKGDKKPSPLKTFIDSGKNLFADLKPARLDPKTGTGSTGSLTQTGKGSTPNLGPIGSGTKGPKTVETDKPSGITDVSKGQGASSKGQIPAAKPVAETSAKPVAEVVEAEEPHLVEEVSDDDGPDANFHQ